MTSEEYFENLGPGGLLPGDMVRPFIRPRPPTKTHVGLVLSISGTGYVKVLWTQPIAGKIFVGEALVTALVKL